MSLVVNLVRFPQVVCIVHSHLVYDHDRLDTDGRMDSSETECLRQLIAKPQPSTRFDNVFVVILTLMPSMRKLHLAVHFAY